MNAIVNLAVFGQTGTNRRKTLIRSNPIHEVYPHEPNLFYHTGFGRRVRTHTDARLTIDFDKCTEFVNKVERELNAGLTSFEAERVFPRAGQHNRTVYFVKLLSNTGNRIF